jgi:hypothetical protein
MRDRASAKHMIAQKSGSIVNTSANAGIFGVKGGAQAIKSMAENPRFNEHPISSPVVITDVPRTGATALHRLMAVDERFQGLQT